MKGVKSVSRVLSFFLFFLQVDVQHHLLKRQSLFYCISFGSFSKISWLYGSLFLGSLFCSIDIFVYFSSISYFLDD